MYKKYILLGITSLLLISLVNGVNSYSDANIKNSFSALVTASEESLIAIPDPIVVDIDITKTTIDVYKIVETTDEEENSITIKEFVKTEKDKEIEISSNFNIENNTSNNIVLTSIEFDDDNDYLMDLYNLYESVDGLDIFIKHDIDEDFDAEPRRSNKYNNPISGTAILKFTWDDGEAIIKNDLEINIDVIEHYKNYIMSNDIIEN